jgi:large-conductance mechanosensitive channel
LLLGLIDSKLLSPLNVVWVKFGELLGRIIAPVVMAIIYFFIITPIGLFMRLTRKDLLKIKSSNKQSYWIKREKNIGSMKRQF